MKIVNIDRKFLHIFWTTWENSMEFSVKICFKIILKVTKPRFYPLFRKYIWPFNSFDPHPPPPPGILG